MKKATVRRYTFLLLFSGCCCPRKRRLRSIHSCACAQLPFASCSRWPKPNELMHRNAQFKSISNACVDFLNIFFSPLGSFIACAKEGKTHFSRRISLRSTPHFAIVRQRYWRAIHTVRCALVRLQIQNKYASTGNARSFSQRKIASLLSRCSPIFCCGRASE